MVQGRAKTRVAPERPWLTLNEEQKKGGEKGRKWGDLYKNEARGELQKEVFTLLTCYFAESAIREGYY